MALVPIDHPFAARETLTQACLLHEPIYADNLPPVGLDSLIDLVATGQLIAVVGHSVVDRLGQHVVAVPVTGLPPKEVLLAWLADSHDPRLARLLDLARQLHHHGAAPSLNTP